MKIVHFSDWHAKFVNLPKADLYIATGDFCPNFPYKVFNSPNLVLNKNYETQQQLLWLEQIGSWRQFLASPDAPVVVVRGNHDFIDLASAFGGEVFEITHDATRTVEYCGLKIGGTRGINYMGNIWNDELHQIEWQKRCEDLPMDLDVLVTHTPPIGILDKCYSVHIGTAELTRYITKRIYAGQNVKPLKLHCFGHAHEARGIDKQNDIKAGSNIIFSNAATTYHEIEL